MAHIRNSQPTQDSTIDHEQIGAGVHRARVIRSQALYLFFSGLWQSLQRTGMAGRQTAA